MARLQEEKCSLQAQLLSGGNPGAQAQVAGLLRELSEGRERIEGLLQERAALQARLEALQQGSSNVQQQDAAIVATSQRLAAQQVDVGAGCLAQLCTQLSHSMPTPFLPPCTVKVAHALAETAHVREELAAVRRRLTDERAALDTQLSEERASRAELESRLQDTLSRLGAAEALASQTEQTARALEQEQARCLALAGQLEREQVGAEEVGSFDLL